MALSLMTPVLGPGIMWDPDNIDASFECGLLAQAETVAAKIAALAHAIFLFIGSSSPRVGGQNGETIRAYLHLTLTV